MTQALKPIPKIGKQYHFFDDGRMAEKEFVDIDGKTYYYGKYGRKIYFANGNCLTMLITKLST